MIVEVITMHSPSLRHFEVEIVELVPIPEAIPGEKTPITGATKQRQIVYSGGDVFEAERVAHFYYALKSSGQ